MRSGKAGRKAAAKFKRNRCYAITALGLGIQPGFVRAHLERKATVDPSATIARDAATTDLIVPVQVEASSSPRQPGIMGTTAGTMVTAKVNGRKEAKAEEREQASTSMGKVREECRQLRVFGRTQSG